MGRRSIFLLIAGWLLAGPAVATEVEKGKALAEALCASCHMGPNQGEKQGPNGIPGFRAVANRPSQTFESVVRWLNSKPAVMPDHHLTTDETDALASFVMSLRTVP